MHGNKNVHIYTDMNCRAVNEAKTLLETLDKPKFKPSHPFIADYIAPSGGGKTASFVRMLMDISKEYDHVILISPSGYPDEDCGLMSDGKWGYAHRKQLIHQCFADYNNETLEQIVEEQSQRLRQYKLYLDLKKLWDKLMRGLTLSDK